MVFTFIPPQTAVKARVRNLILLTTLLLRQITLFPLFNVIEHALLRLLPILHHVFKYKLCMQYNATKMGLDGGVR
jgi:hypothetical protein